MRKTFIFSLALSCLVSGCSTAPRPAPQKLPQDLTTEEMLAAVQPVTDCEWKAAAQYDDGHSSVAALAERIVGICGREILKAERAFHVSPNDSDAKMDEFKQAIETVEHVRRNK